MKGPAAMAPFWVRFPGVAAKETRCLTVLEPRLGVPPGVYYFNELYCTDPACDCRRVLLQVVEQERLDTVLATINYGWENEEFYDDWMRGDREAARDIMEASLDPINPQSDMADGLLELFREVVLDEAYISRLAMHYSLFKQSRPRPHG